MSLIVSTISSQSTAIRTLALEPIEVADSKNRTSLSHPLQTPCTLKVPNRACLPPFCSLSERRNAKLLNLATCVLPVVVQKSKMADV